MKRLAVLIRKNKKHETFYCRMYHKPSGNTKDITLGKKTKSFTQVEATKKIQYLQENFANGNYDIDTLLYEYENNHINEEELTLNDVAELYFQSIETRNFEDFFEEYKNRYNFKTQEDVKNNQVYKNKMKGHKNYIRYYINYIKVDEWIYKREKTKTGKIKQSDTKVKPKMLSLISKKVISEITQQDIEKRILKIKNIENLSLKTKYMIITVFKSIFNYAKEERYIENNVFNNIKKQEFIKNPNNFRKRILDIQEMNLLMKTLSKLNNQNSFRASLLGFATASRVGTVLNIRVEDFKFKEGEFNDAFYTVDLINFKTMNKYTLPLNEKIGRYFYHLIRKEYKNKKSYVIRHQTPSKRKFKPYAQLPKDFKETCDRTVSTTYELRELFKQLDNNNEQIKVFKNNMQIDTVKKLVNNLEEENKFYLEEIKKEKQKYLQNKEDYLAQNFSFHNFRHLTLSLIALHNPYMSVRVGNHQVDKRLATTDKYIKIEHDKLKNVIDKSLDPYLGFLDPMIDDITKDFDLEDAKRDHQFSTHDEPRLNAIVNIFDSQEKLDQKSFQNELYEILNDTSLSMKSKEDKIAELEGEYFYYTNKLEEKDF